MSETRRGEQRPYPFRTGRVFSVGPHWYFATREDGDRGPFDSREEAEAELRLYVRDKVTADQRIADG